MDDKVRRTQAGDLPPSSNVTGVRCSTAARETTLVTAPLPVSKRWSKRCVSNADREAAAQERAAATAARTALDLEVVCLEAIPSDIDRWLDIKMKNGSTIREQFEKLSARTGSRARSGSSGSSPYMSKTRGRRTTSRRCLHHLDRGQRREERAPASALHRLSASARKIPRPRANTSIH